MDLFRPTGPDVEVSQSHINIHKCFGDRSRFDTSKVSNSIRRSTTYPFSAAFHKIDPSNPAHHTTTLPLRSSPSSTFTNSKSA